MDKYEKLNEIGKGSFGSVYKIKRLSDGKILCWKELDYGRMQEREKQQLVSEVNALNRLNHINIVKYYDKIIQKEKNKLYIIMEYCENGDMAQLIKKCRAERDFVAEDVIWKIFMQVLLALNECHNKKDDNNPVILHRDLKPGNLFFDKNNNVKLGDFGLCRILSAESQYAHTNVGTPYYMSPEQIQESNYDAKTDIWSLGCVLYEIVALRPPFQATNHLALASKIISSQIERIPMRYSEDLQNVISWMLNKDPEKRPNVEDLLALPKIQLRINERKMKEDYDALKRREEEVYQKYKKLKVKERELKTREEQLNQRQEIARKKKEKLMRAAEIENQNLMLLSMKINGDESEQFFRFTDDINNFDDTDRQFMHSIDSDQHGCPKPARFNKQNTSNTLNQNNQLQNFKFDQQQSFVSQNEQSHPKLLTTSSKDEYFQKQNASVHDKKRDLHHQNSSGFLIRDKSNGSRNSSNEPEYGGKIRRIMANKGLSTTQSKQNQLEETSRNLQTEEASQIYSTMDNPNGPIKQQRRLSEKVQRDKRSLDKHTTSKTPPIPKDQTRMSMEKLQGSFTTGVKEFDLQKSTEGLHNQETKQQYLMKGQSGGHRNHNGVQMTQRAPRKSSGSALKQQLSTQRNKQGLVQNFGSHTQNSTKIHQLLQKVRNQSDSTKISRQGTQPHSIQNLQSFKQASSSKPQIETIPKQKSFQSGQKSSKNTNYLAQTSSKKHQISRDPQEVDIQLNQKISDFDISNTQNSQIQRTRNNTKLTEQNSQKSISMSQKLITHQQSTAQHNTIDVVHQNTTLLSQHTDPDLILAQKTKHATIDNRKDTTPTSGSKNAIYQSSSQKNNDSEAQNTMGSYNSLVQKFKQESHKSKQQFKESMKTTQSSQALPNCQENQQNQLKSASVLSYDNQQTSQVHSHARPPSSSAQQTLLRSAASQQQSIYKQSSVLAGKQAIADNNFGQTQKVVTVNGIDAGKNTGVKLHNLIAGGFMSPQQKQGIPKRNSESLGLISNSIGSNLVSQSVQLSQNVTPMHSNGNLLFSNQKKQPTATQHEPQQHNQMYTYQDKNQEPPQSQPPKQPLLHLHHQQHPMQQYPLQQKQQQTQQHHSSGTTVRQASNQSATVQQTKPYQQHHLKQYQPQFARKQQQQSSQVQPQQQQMMQAENTQMPASIHKPPSSPIQQQSGKPVMGGGGNNVVQRDQSVGNLSISAQQAADIAIQEYLSQQQSMQQLKNQSRLSDGHNGGL